MVVRLLVLYAPCLLSLAVLHANENIASSSAFSEDVGSPVFHNTVLGLEQNASVQI